MDARDRPDASDIRDVLHRFDEILAQAARRLEASDEATRGALVAQLLGLRAAMQAAAGAVGSARATPRTARDAWLHGIRDSITVIGGWADFLVAARDASRRRRARAALDQCMGTLRERLARPPS